MDFGGFDRFEGNVEWLDGKFGGFVGILVVSGGRGGGFEGCLDSFGVEWAVVGMEGEMAFFWVGGGF